MSIEDSPRLEQVAQVMRTQSPRQPGAALTSGVYLFFSFDLVNSTQYKVARPDRWPVVFTQFYELVSSEVLGRFPAKLWKYAGDEVLFHQRMSGMAELSALLPATYEALHAIIAHLHRAFPDTAPILSVKATVWIAKAEYVPPSSLQDAKLSMRNLITPSVTPSPDRLESDFLGPDIDAGFRISKFVERSRLVVSAHLAALLYRYRAECPDIEKRCRIVAYEPLKGVWGDRRYPIIWYENDWERVAETFQYDEHFHSPLVRAIKENPPGLDTQLKNIERIFRDLGREPEITELDVWLTEAVAQRDTSATVEPSIPAVRYSEMHCVAVCFSPDGRVLLGRRPFLKRRLPGKWEFGCAQLRMNQTFRECLEARYIEDFGAQLRLPAEPVPFATFMIEDAGEHRKIPGLFFVAEVENPEEVQELYMRDRHPEICWLSMDEVSQLEPSECVPDLQRRIPVAYDIWVRERAMAR